MCELNSRFDTAAMQEEENGDLANQNSAGKQRSRDGDGDVRMKDGR